LRQAARKLDVIRIDLNGLLWAEIHLLRRLAAARAISATDQ
jgi:hypothetical protein